MNLKILWSSFAFTMAVAAGSKRIDEHNPLDASSTTTTSKAEASYNGLEIIGAGYPRTGTSSLREALNILGYKTYHMETVMNSHNDDNHIVEWTSYFRGEHTLSDLTNKVYHNELFTAAVDAPTSVIWKELANDVYPNAKIIVTERTSSEKWWNSASETVLIPSPVIKLLIKLSPYWRSFSVLLEYVYQSYFNLEYPRLMTHDDKDISIKAYEDNIILARKFQQQYPDRVLFFQASQGWEPLCEFLNKPIPSIKYPHVNNRKEFSNHHMKQFIYMFVLPTSCIVIAAKLIKLLWSTKVKMTTIQKSSPSSSKKCKAC